MIAQSQDPARRGSGRQATVGKLRAAAARAAMLVMLWFVSPGAGAAGADTASTAAAGLRAVESALQGVQGNLDGIGSNLFLYLAFLGLVWWAMQLVLTGGDIRDTFGGFLRTAFLLGLAYFFMRPYAAGQTPLVWFVGKLSDAVTSALTASANGDVAGVAATAFADLYRMIGKLMQVFTQPFHSTSGWLGGLDAIGVVFANLPMVLFLGLTIILLWLAGITLFVMAVIGLVMFKLADVFAPLFIPFLALPVVSWLFDGWLRFLLSGAMYKIAGAAIVMLGSAVLDSMFALIGGGTLNWGQLTIAGMVVAGLAFSLLYVMLQLPSIAHGLISGHATVQMQKMMGHIGRGAQYTGGATIAGAGGGMAAAGRGMEAAGAAQASAKAAAQSPEARWAMLGGMAAREAGGAGEVKPLEPGRLSTLQRAGRAVTSAGGAMSRAGTSLMRKTRRD